MQLWVQVIWVRGDEFARLLSEEGIRFKRNGGRFRIRNELDIARVLSSCGVLRRSFVDFVRRRGGTREKIREAAEVCVADYRTFFEAAGRVADGEDE